MPLKIVADKGKDKPKTGKGPETTGQTKGSTKSGGQSEGQDELATWLASRQLLKPEDQLDLTEAELSEEISKVLTQDNGNVALNKAIYSFKEGEYIILPKPSSTVVLFSMEGTLLHLESDDAKEQLARMLAEGEIVDFGGPYNEPEDADEPSVNAEGEGEDVEEEALQGEMEAMGEDEGFGEEEEAEAAGGDADAEQVAEQVPRKRKLINQFNFSERDALAYLKPQRSVGIQTILPSKSTYSATCLQWIIHDAYELDYASHAKDREKKVVARPVEEVKKKINKNAVADELRIRYKKCWQIVERIINQNIYDDIAFDYRYWHDPSDEFRDQEGTLLPLWKFSYDKTQNMNVTNMCFNTLYYDLFAVCYGFFDFAKQCSPGAVCFFTIKNPSFPEYIIQCESGVMCCDIHPKYPFLLAIGMYDGNVAVYNMQENSSEPIYASKGLGDKHSDMISEIKWADDLPDGEINFYTLSGDGKVNNWMLLQNRLYITTINTLLMENSTVRGPDGIQIQLKSFGTCMAFHPETPEIFLVGTEEGLIYKCNTTYVSRYLMTYKAHNLPIYRVDYNRFNPNIFVSCSEDWCIKVWEDMRSEPLFIFDVGAPCGDVKWAPYSSTVLAAVTIESKVFVFDINVNKYQPICVQTVVSRKRYKLQRIEFNKVLPFIIVGDDKGQVTSLKLSPNLRLQEKIPKKQQITQAQLQTQKLANLLSLVREV